MNNKKGFNPEINSAFIDRKIPVAKFGKLTITQEDGTKKVLSPTEAKKYIKEMVFGGKKIPQVDKQLYKDGVRGRYWGERKRLTELLSKHQDSGLDDNETNELKEELASWEAEEEND